MENSFSLEYDFGHFISDLFSSVRRTSMTNVVLVLLLSRSDENLVLSHWTIGASNLSYAFPSLFYQVLIYF